jgi:hypothetical protein
MPCYGKNRRTKVADEPEQTHTRCKKKTCSQCVALEQCSPHIEVPERPRFEFPSDEDYLAER